MLNVKRMRKAIFRGMADVEKHEMNFLDGWDRERGESLFEDFKARMQRKYGPDVKFTITSYASDPISSKYVLEFKVYL